MPPRKPHPAPPVPVVLPAEGFVRLGVVLAVFPVSQSAWWRGVKTGKYPKPVRISERIPAWNVREIRALLEQAANGGMVAMLVLAVVLSAMVWVV